MGMMLCNTVLIVSRSKIVLYCIVLEPAQAILLGDFAKDLYQEEPTYQRSVRFANISLRSHRECEFTAYKRAPISFVVNDEAELCDFCGDIRYEFMVDLSRSSDLFIEYAGEYCQVEIGDRQELSIGGRLSMDVRRILGKQLVRVTIANTMTYAQSDELMKYSYQPSAGIFKIKY